MERGLVAFARRPYPSLLVLGILINSHRVCGHRSLLLSLGGCLLLTLLKDRTRLLHLGSEVLLVRQQLLVVDSGFIKNHTGHGRGLFLAIRGEDRSVDVVSNEVLTFLAFKEVKRTGIDLRQLQQFGRIPLLLLRHGWVRLLLLLLHLVATIALVVVSTGLMLPVVVASASALITLVVLVVTTTMVTVALVATTTTASAALASSSVVVVIATTMTALPLSLAAWHS